MNSTEFLARLKSGADNHDMDTISDLLLERGKELSAYVFPQIKLNDVDVCIMAILYKSAYESCLRDITESEDTTEMYCIVSELFVSESEIVKKRGKIDE